MAQHAMIVKKLGLHSNQGKLQPSMFSQGKSLLPVPVPRVEPKNRTFEVSVQWEEILP